MKRVFLLYFLLMLSCQNQSSKREYPVTEKIPVIDTYFDQEVIDNYRWLEDDNSEKTKGWVAQQNEVTFDYLDQIPFGNN